MKDIIISLSDEDHSIDNSIMVIYVARNVRLVLLVQMSTLETCVMFRQRKPSVNKRDQSAPRRPTFNT